MEPVKGEEAIEMEFEQDFMVENVNNEVAPNERNYSIENAVSISRQWGVLLDDYRYLLQKFSSGCSCHLTFDNMSYLKGMEQRYEALRKMANDNEYLSAFSNDDNDWQTLNSIWQNCGTKGSETAQPRMIRRITVINDESSKSNSMTTHNSARNSVKASPTKRIKLPEEGDDNDTQRVEIDLSSLPTKVYRCEVRECDFTTISKDKCDAHVRHYHQAIPEPCFVVNDTVLQICHECGKEFNTEEGLKNHIQNAHVNVKMFACDVSGCNYKTKFRSCFRDHMTRHSGSKNYRCDGYEGCERVFSTKRDLMAHIKFHHQSVRKFVCSFHDCGLSFKDSNRLKHHQYTHTGERPYKCKYRDCDSSFKQIPHLKKHEKIHMNKQAEEEVEYEAYAELEDGQTIYCPADDCAEEFGSRTELHAHIQEAHPGQNELYACFDSNCAQVFFSVEAAVKHLQEVHGQTVETTVETEEVVA